MKILIDDLINQNKTLRHIYSTEFRENELLTALDVIIAKHSTVSALPFADLFKLFRGYFSKQSTFTASRETEETSNHLALPVSL